MSDPGVEDLIEAIAEKHIAYETAVGKLCEGVSRERLLETVQELRRQAADPEDRIKDEHERWADLIEVAIGYSIAFERAEVVFKAGGTAYCLFHDGDMRNCPPGSHG